MPTWLVVLAALIVLGVLALSGAAGALAALGTTVLLVGFLGIAHARGRTRA